MSRSFVALRALGRHGALLFLLLVTACSGLRGREDHYRVPPAEAAASSPVLLDQTERANDPGEPLVQLCCRRSWIVETLAVHPWFVVWNPRWRRWESWEVYSLWGNQWGRRTEPAGVVGLGSTARWRAETSLDQWGTIDRDTGPGHTPSQDIVLAEWRGANAEAIVDVLERPWSYPAVSMYRYWPGPNSNTYVAWVLREAGVAADLHPLMVGKDHVGPWGFGAAWSHTLTGVRLETPLLGLEVGALDGVEFHVLGLTLGLDAWPPALKTPLGRYGVAE